MSGQQSSNRFNTVGRNVHLLGRLSLSFNLDSTAKQIVIRVDSARQLQDRHALAQPASQQVADFTVFTRIQIHTDGTTVKNSYDNIITKLFSAQVESSRQTSNTW